MSNFAERAELVVDSVGGLEINRRMGTEAVWEGVIHCTEEVGTEARALETTSGFLVETVEKFTNDLKAKGY